ncbi:unnamed protein product, partial [Cyprideis torosa]
MRQLLKSLTKEVFVLELDAPVAHLPETDLLSLTRIDDDTLESGRPSPQGDWQRMNTKEKWIAFQAIFIKEILRFSRIWMQTILPPAIMTALYFVIFGGLIGPRIGEMEGFTYMEFIVPGLIMMSVITNSYANVVSSFYMAKFSHSIEEMLVSPVPDWVVLAGYVGGGVARGMAVGFTVTLVSLFFSDLNLHSLGIMISTALLTAI